MNRALNITNGLLLLIYSIGAFWLIPNFKKLFVGLEIELPLVTKIIISTYGFWWLLILIPIIVHFIFIRSVKNTQSNFLTKVLVIKLALLIVLIPFIIYALYLPIFNAASQIT